MVMRCARLQAHVPCDPRSVEGFWEIEDIPCNLVAAVRPLTLQHYCCQPMYERDAESVVDRVVWNTFYGPGRCIRPSYTEAIRRAAHKDATLQSLFRNELHANQPLPDVQWLRHRVIVLVRD